MKNKQIKVVLLGLVIIMFIASACVYSEEIGQQVKQGEGMNQEGKTLSSSGSQVKEIKDEKTTPPVDAGGSFCCYDGLGQIVGHCPTSGDYFASGKCYSTLQDCNGHGGFCHEAVTCYPIDSTQSEPTQPVTPENPHPCTGKVYFSEGSGFCCPAGYLYSTSCKSGVCYRTSNDAYNDTEGCSTITEGISQ